MDLLFYAVNIALYKIIFLHTGILGGWTEPQMMIFVSGFLVIDAIYMTLFSNNLYMFPMFVNRGDLDYYLIRPVSSLFFLSLRDFATNSFINLVLSLCIMTWAIQQYTGPFSFGLAILFFILLGLGTFLHYLVQILFLIPIFWTHSARGLQTIAWLINHTMEKPDRIFTGWVRRILVSILPFSLMASYPARLVLDDFEWGTLLHLVGVIAVFFVAITSFWKVGLKNYSSASS